LTTCPCCGSKLSADLQREACAACGARAVGPPLARPARELPSYIRALVIGASGMLLLAVFAISTLVTLFERKSSSFSFWDFVAAGETAAWGLKWLALPTSVLVVWASTIAYLKMRRDPTRHLGFAVARAGLAMSVAVVFGLTLLIAVTIPERLRQRELARQAADDAVRHRIDRVLLAYKAIHGTLPASIEDLSKQLPDDKDGSVARVIDALQSGTYKPEADLASIPPPNAKGRGRRIGSVRLRAVSSAWDRNTDDTPGQGFSLTNYEIVLPGRDEVFNTTDDIRIRDGLPVESPSPARTSPTPAKAKNITL